MEFLPTELPEVRRIRPRVFTDGRGVFLKTFHAPTFLAAGIDLSAGEEFYTISHRNVVRGMHFHLPPHSQARLVTCMAGRILDVVVDLRRASPAYGKVMAVELSGENRELLYIPEGFAHGFVSLEDDSLVNYVASRPYSPAHDTGIAWDSIGFAWPVTAPIMSDRDRAFPALRDFNSPF